MRELARRDRQRIEGSAQANYPPSDAGDLRFDAVGATVREGRHRWQEPKRVVEYLVDAVGK